MTGNCEHIKIELVAIGALLILSLNATTFGQGAGRETPKPSSTKPPTSKPAAKRPTRRSTSGAVKPLNPHIELVRIPPGSFMMGSNNGRENEKPAHEVRIRQSFYMGKYEVTQAQWRMVMGNNPSEKAPKRTTTEIKNCDNCPVEMVSWDDAQKFIRKLNQINDGYTYRLPTEAEWEYSARAGTTTTYFWGEDVNRLCQYANGADQSAKEENPIWKIVINCRDGYAATAPVGSFQPNAFGLYDMIGNVWEWCEDWYHETHYGAPTDGKAWSRRSNQKYRVLRGGRWNDWPEYLTSAARAGREYDCQCCCGGGVRLVAVARTQ